MKNNLILKTDKWTNGQTDKILFVLMLVFWFPFSAKVAFTQTTNAVTLSAPNGSSGCPTVTLAGTVSFDAEVTGMVLQLKRETPTGIVNVGANTYISNGISEDGSISFTPIQVNTSGV